MATRNLTANYEGVRARFRSRARSMRAAPGPGEVLLPEDVALNVGPKAELPPEWVDIVDQIQQCITEIKTKMRQLQKLHSARLKVTFAEEEESRQEREIEILTGETTRLFHKAENGLKRIAMVGNTGTLAAQERVVRLNVMRNLAGEIQGLSKTFRNLQREFVTGLKAQSSIDAKWGFEDETKHAVSLDEAMDRGFTQEHLQQIREMEEDATQREKEILKIAQSVAELAQLFKELNVLVIEQGTIIDRIDYNVDQVYARVTEGRKELQKADEYSRKSRMVLCMFVMIVIVIILGAMLIYKHRSKSSDPPPSTGAGSTGGSSGLLGASGVSGAFFL